MTKKKSSSVGSLPVGYSVSVVRSMPIRYSASDWSWFRDRLAALDDGQVLRLECADSAKLKAVYSALRARATARRFPNSRFPARRVVEGGVPVLYVCRQVSPPVLPRLDQEVSQEVSNV
jgi:hypothetical protein